MTAKLKRLFGKNRRRYIIRRVRELDELGCDASEMHEILNGEIRPEIDLSDRQLVYNVRNGLVTE